jgi:hypothetical protein
MQSHDLVQKIAFIFVLIVFTWVILLNGYNIWKHLKSPEDCGVDPIKETPAETIKNVEN